MAHRGARLDDLARVQQVGADLCSKRWCIFAFQCSSLVPVCLRQDIQAMLQSSADVVKELSSFQPNTDLAQIKSKDFLSTLKVNFEMMAVGLKLH